MGGWELFCVGRGENTDGMSTDNPGDKPECWTFGKLGPAPNGDTLPEASSPPCMAVTKGLPQREHSMGPGKKPRARHKFFVSGSSVFWSRLSSSPHRRTPSLCQGQQREGERETGECKGGRVGGARWEGAEVGGKLDCPGVVTGGNPAQHGLEQNDPRDRYHKGIHLQETQV